ncbi:hypothetical protein GCM10023322_22800 [Rugosimonospora acidiphila]|uniref:Secreted protein n=1 Tax=Rugosimonospora acidiphila TaxID=556531 RepID=A0ABP9RPH6_9ACTN
MLRRTASSLATLAMSTAALAGCGFVGAHNVSDQKPNGFVLRGHVSVPVPAGDSGKSGAACDSSLPGVAPNTQVKVTDPQGHEIAVGYLGDGLIGASTSGNTCDFPFEIPQVPGGVASYGLTVAGRPTQTFPAESLRESQTAVISFDS